jgi:hypothetical protein
LPNGRLPRGRSLDQNPFGGPPPDLSIGLYKWLTRDPRIFMPLWYPLVTILFKPTNKFPYQKLQYLMYMKDTDMMLTLEFSRRQTKLMGRLWSWLISSTYLVLFYETIF